MCIRDGVAVTCTRGGFTSEVEVGHFREDAQGFVAWYSADSGSTPPVDNFSIEVYAIERFGGPSTPGVYPIQDENYADCGLCVTGRWSCGADGRCANGFLASNGTVEITEMPQAVGDAFGGTVSNVWMRAVTVSGADVSTPVPGGDVWCIDGFSFRVPAVTPMPE